MTLVPGEMTAVASDRAEQSLTHPELPALHLCSFLFNMSSFLKATETMYATQYVGLGMWDKFGYFFPPESSFTRRNSMGKCWCPSRVTSFPVSPGPVEVEQIRQCLGELPGSHQVTAQSVAVTTLATLQFSRLTSHIPLLRESPQGLGLPCLSSTAIMGLSASPAQ